MRAGIAINLHGGSEMKKMAIALSVVVIAGALTAVGAQTVEQKQAKIREQGMQECWKMGALKKGFYQRPCTKMTNAAEKKKCEADAIKKAETEQKECEKKFSK